MVAGLLRILGVDLGTRVNDDNNEDQAFLAHLGDRRVFTDAQFKDRKIEYLQRIKDYIAARSKSGAIWGWKDPLASYYVQEIAKDLVQPAFVVVMRDPVAVAIREQFEERTTSEETTLAYLLNAVSEYRKVIDFLTRPSTSALLISYERALRRPRELVSVIRDFLRLPANSETEDRAYGFIAPGRGTGRID